MCKDKLRLNDFLTIEPINEWYSVAGQSDGHYFIYSDSKKRAFAACGWRALVSDLIELNPTICCLRCEVTLLILAK